VRTFTGPDLEVSGASKWQKKPHLAPEWIERGPDSKAPTLRKPAKDRAPRNSRPKPQLQKLPHPAAPTLNPVPNTVINLLNTPVTNVNFFVLLNP
jgi:hypothetical protein